MTAGNCGYGMLKAVSMAFEKKISKKINQMKFIIKHVIIPLFILIDKLIYFLFSCVVCLLFIIIIIIFIIISFLWDFSLKGFYGIKFSKEFFKGLTKELNFKKRATISMYTFFKEA